MIEVLTLLVVVDIDDVHRAEIDAEAARRVVLEVVRDYPSLASPVRTTALSGSSARFDACGLDANCTRSVLGELGHDAVLAMFVDTRVAPMLVTATLFERDAGRIASVAERAGVGAIREAITRATTRLLDKSRHTRGARLSIATTPSDAVVTVSPEGDGRRIDGDYVLLPGRYEIRATREGHEPASQAVDLTAGPPRRIDLTLEETFVGSGTFWAIVAGAAVAIGAAVAGSVYAYDHRGREAVVRGPP